MKYILLLLCLCFFSCIDDTFDTKEEMVAYLRNPENGYLQNKNINGIDISLMYRPTDLLVLQELGDSITKDKIERLRSKYKKNLYFNLVFSKNGQELLTAIPNNRNEFSTLVNQLAFGMSDKMYITNSKKDTLKMVDYVYPRMYGVTKSTSMMVVFPRDGKKINGEQLNFTIERLGLITRKFTFNFSSTILYTAPKIKFSTCQI